MVDAQQTSKHSNRNFKEVDILILCEGQIVLNPLLSFFEFCKTNNNEIGDVAKYSYYRNNTILQLN